MPEPSFPETYKFPFGIFVMREIQCISEAELMLSILMQLGDFESPLVISKFLIFSEKNKLGSELLRGVVPPNGKGGVLRCH